MLSIDEINKKIYEGKRSCKQSGTEPAKVLMHQTSKNTIVNTVAFFNLPFSSYSALNTKDTYNGLEVMVDNTVDEDFIYVFGHGWYENMNGMKSDYVDLLKAEVSKIK